MKAGHRGRSWISDITISYPHDVGLSRFGGTVNRLRRMRWLMRRGGMSWFLEKLGAKGLTELGSRLWRGQSRQKKVKLLHTIALKLMTTTLLRLRSKYVFTVV